MTTHTITRTTLPPTSWSEGWSIKVEAEGDMMTVSPAPWTDGGTTVSAECGPTGRGYCDGYTDTHVFFCECYCHLTDLSHVSGHNGMEVWHKAMWIDGICYDDLD